VVGLRPFLSTLIISALRNLLKSQHPIAMSARCQTGHLHLTRRSRSRAATQMPYLSVASASGHLNCRIRKGVGKVECLKTFFFMSTVLHRLNQLVVEALVR